MLRSMLLGSTVRLYSPPDDPPAAADPEDTPDPVVKADVEQAAEPEPEAAAAAAEPEPKTEPVPDWKDKELKRKHRQIQDAKARERQLEQELADARALLARTEATDDEEEPPARKAAPASDVVPRSEVRREAENIVAQADFNRSCNEVEKKGKAEYKKEWDEIADTLSTLGGFTTDEMQGILATDDPAKVLYTLGKDPDKFHEIKELPPAKKLAAMVKLALPSDKPKPKPSDAPEPVEPVAGRPGAVLGDLDDRLSDDEWHAKRDAQRAKRWAARNGQGARA